MISKTLIILILCISIFAISAVQAGEIINSVEPIAYSSTYSSNPAVNSGSRGSSSIFYGAPLPFQTAATTLYHHQNSAAGAATAVRLQQATPLPAMFRSPSIAAATNAAATAVAPSIAVARYSPATTVSHVYNSITAAPTPTHLTYAPAHLTAYHLTTTPEAISSSQQKVVRTFDGTVSQYSKAVDTPFSSVRKYDTRVNNNVYVPAIETKFALATLPATATATLYTHHQPIHMTSIYAARGTPNAVVYATNPSISYLPSSATTTTAITPITHVTFEGLGTHYAW